MIVRTRGAYRAIDRLAQIFDLQGQMREVEIREALQAQQFRLPPGPGVEVLLVEILRRVRDLRCHDPFRRRRAVQSSTSDPSMQPRGRC